MRGHHCDHLFLLSSFLTACAECIRGKGRKERAYLHFPELMSWMFAIFYSSFPLNFKVPKLMPYHVLTC